MQSKTPTSTVLYAVVQRCIGARTSESSFLLWQAAKSVSWDQFRDVLRDKAELWAAILTVSFEDRVRSSPLKSPPIMPADPGAGGTATALPPSPISYTRGSGADITIFVVFKSPAR